MGNERASRVAAALWADDTASAGLGMRLVAVSDDTAVLEMPVRDDMVNGHGIAHGGFTVLLASPSARRVMGLTSRAPSNAQFRPGGPVTMFVSLDRESS